jgi:hypothetical protein
LCTYRSALVTVVGDDVVATEPALPSTAVLTISKVFDLLDEAAREHWDLVEVTYDPQGWPTSLRVDADEQAADDGGTWTFTDLVPIDPATAPPSSAVRLDAAEARWSSLGWTSYALDVERVGNQDVPAAIQGRFHVVVHAGSVAAVTDDQGHAADLAAGVTAEDLFALARTSLDLTTTFDPASGIPTELVVRGRPSTIGDDSTLGVGAIRCLEGCATTG